jgi:hypothetical protein
VKFEDLEVGQTVYMNFDDQWHDGEITTLIGDQPPNKGRNLVEVNIPGYSFEIFDAENLYPAPNFYTTYKMVDIVDRIPDNRVYEFGIGDINNADDPYFAQTQKTNPTGKRRMILLKTCDGCGGEFPSVEIMSASLGRACLNCYDRMSG